jgi:hypothetical protein
MNTVASKKTQCSSSTGPVDLLGARIPEQKKQKGLGYLGKKELIAEVRQIFPNAKIFPNTPGYKQQQR